jgi:hypothetical protein
MRLAAFVIKSPFGQFVSVMSIAEYERAEITRARLARLYGESMEIIEELAAVNQLPTDKGPIILGE